jgi:hypothetical protein
LLRGNFAHTLLFGDPATYGNPDKVVAEGYRRIPLMFPQYDIQPHVWNPKTSRMEPLSLSEYDRYLAGIDAGSTKAMREEGAARKNDAPIAQAVMQIEKGSASKMSKVAAAEKYNLAVGVYTGFVEAYNRVKPTARTTAQIDLVQMVKSANATTVDEAVDYFCKRLLSVPLHADRRSAVVQFLQGELGTDRFDFGNEKLAGALRQLVHLILSSPEYQLG